jgi:hypothetical protein
VHVRYNRLGLRRHCTGVVEYDGQQDGVFVYSHKTLVAYEVLADCINNIPIGQKSFFQHWQKMKSIYSPNRQGDMQQFWSRSTHR